MAKRMRQEDDWRLDFISQTKFSSRISPFRAISLFRAAIGRKSKPSVRKLAAHSVHGMNEKHIAYIGKGGKFYFWRKVLYLERRIDKFRWTIPIDLKDFWQDKMFFRLQADCFLSSHIDRNCINISTYACPTSKEMSLKEGLKIAISPDKRPRSVMNLIKNGATLFILYSDSEGQDRNELWNCADPNKPRRVPFPDISGLVPARDQHMSFTEGWTIGQTREILIKDVFGGCLIFHGFENARFAGSVGVPGHNLDTRIVTIDRKEFLIEERVTGRPFKGNRKINMFIIELVSGKVVFDAELDGQHFFNGVNIFPNLNEMEEEETWETRRGQGIALHRLTRTSDVEMISDTVELPDEIDLTENVEFYTVSDSRILWENGNDFFLVDYLL